MNIGAAASVEMLRDRARALSTAKAWPDLCALFDDAGARDHVDAPGTGRPVELPAELANLRAEALLRTGRATEARDWLVQVLPGIERRGDRSALRQATNLLGAATFELGELSWAQSSFERALDLGQRDGDDLLVARATNNLGAIANVQGQRERALAMYAIAIAAYQRLGQVRGLAAANHNMAITFRHLESLDRADECERRAIEFALDAGNEHFAAMARLGRAEIGLLRGDARFAEVSAMRLAAELAALADRIQQANALRVAAAARLQLGDLGGADAVLGEGLQLARANFSPLIEAELLRTRAHVHAARGDVAAAMSDAWSAIEIFDRLEASTDRDELRNWLAAMDGGPAMYRHDAGRAESGQLDA